MKIFNKCPIALALISTAASFGMTPGGEEYSPAYFINKTKNPIDIYAKDVSKYFDKNYTKKVSLKPGQVSQELYFTKLPNNLSQKDMEALEKTLSYKESNYGSKAFKIGFGHPNKPGQEIDIHRLVEFFASKKCPKPNKIVVEILEIPGKVYGSTLTYDVKCEKEIKEAGSFAIPAWQNFNE